MKYFSMFSGIGGFELGIHRAIKRVATSREVDVASAQPLSESGNEKGGLGTSCVGFSEIEERAIEIYKTHFKEHKNYGSATEIDPEKLPDFDLLVGGFPCQAFSVAGKRLGFDDTRGTLFFEIARILKVKRPRMCLLENVKGLLSHDSGRTFKTIIAALVELGYGVEWQVLNSKDFGVAQNRERVFIIGHLGGVGSGQVFPIRESDEPFSAPGNEHVVSGTISTKNQSGQAQFDGSTTLIIKRVAHNDLFRRYNQTYDPTGLVESLDTSGGGGGHQPCVPVIVNRGELVETEDKALCLDKSYHKGFDNHGQRTGIKFSETKIRRLTPVECERLQGFPDNWTAGVSDTARYKCLGNAVTVPVIKAIMLRVLMALEGGHNSPQLTDRQRGGKTMIENILERIANALERIAGLPQLPNGLVAATPLEKFSPEDVEAIVSKPRARKAKTVEADEAQAPQPPVAETITPDAIAAELRLFVTKFGTQKAKDLLTRFGANRVSEIKPEDFVPVLDALKAALKVKA